jgi:hypothetical protein
MSKFLLIRILGNDLPGIHGDEQTITNLTFTLENEPTFKNTDKLFILNRIYSLDKKQILINLLNKYNINYIDIPFNITEFNKLPKIDISLNEFNNLTKRNKIHLLYKHNIFLINNNGCRNFSIEYGKKNGYTWTFVIDSNNFFTEKAFEDIITNIRETDEYIILPQKRLKDGNLDNDILLLPDNEQLIYNLPTQEPQIAFKNTSTFIFNDNIPYGISPKAEFINALGVKGNWNNWSNFFGLNIHQRKFTNINYNILSYVIRLHPYNKNNNIKDNWILRLNGIFLLVKSIRDSKNDIF